MKRIPVKGERIVHQVRKTKSGIKQLFVPGMFLKTWTLPIWDLWTGMISESL